MPIVFRCSACNRRLSIATRKAGTQTACPNCKATVTVPGASPTANAADEPDDVPVEVEPTSNLRTILMTACVALVLFSGLALALTFALRKPNAPEQAKGEAPANVAPAPVPAPPAPAKPQAALNPITPQPPQQQQQPEPTPNNPQQPADPQQPSQQPTPQPQPQPQQPAPQPVVQAPAPKPPPDKFGNPSGPNLGLAQDGEFKGKKLLFWCAFENTGKVFFHPTNPLWKALEAKGFAVTFVFGKFNPAWLKEIDQLWILSSGKMDIPAGITPNMLADAVSLLPPEAVPSGFTLQEYQFIVRATLDVAFSPRHMLDAQAYKSIEEFVKAGKGLCLLADDEPFTTEADELARRLFGARVGGNYIADKVATVRGRGLTPAEVKKYGGQYEVDDHALLTDVNFLFEGITVSNVGKSDKLDAALKASDGKTLIAVSKLPGQRVVIDCGFTRYCHGPTERTSYILKTPGTIRLAQNLAAYLAGKDAKR